MKRYIYFSAFAAMLAACEYTPEETNYHEVMPPSQFTGEITLNDFNPESTFSIDKPTEFTYSFKSEHLRLHQAIIELDGNEIDRVNAKNASTFYIYPLYMASGNHKIKVTFIASRISNTKSLAELTVAEMYQLEATWNLKTISNADYSTIGYRFTEKGQLELYWDNPAIPDDDIYRYSLESKGDPASFYDAWAISSGRKSIIIPRYAIGRKETFILTTYTIEEGHYENDITVDTKVAKAYIEDLGNNTVRVYWDKPVAFANADAIYKVLYQFAGPPSYEEIFTGFETIVYPTSPEEKVIFCDSDTTVVIPKSAEGYDLEGCRVLVYTSDYDPPHVGSMYVSFP